MTLIQVFNNNEIYFNEEDGFYYVDNIAFVSEQDAIDYLSE